jgi:hypothetical protein
MKPIIELYINWKIRRLARRFDELGMLQETIGNKEDL